MTPEILRYRVAASTVDHDRSSARIKESVLDFDTSRGQSATLPGPADLLTLAFAACVLKNVERFSEMLPFRYEHASIDVTAEREGAPPRIARVSYVLTLVTDESPVRVDLLHRNIKKFGTIYTTLAAACDVTGEIVAQPGRGQGG
jgi:uncharacterized OsmC-like protein